ncbi:MAG: hypothetical protein NTV88_00900, partial [Candidatus Micrarchaeota archaeon]|nr:hypothetical protein [Candidatus Micrarchaeota archaeon]
DFQINAGVKVKIGKLSSIDNGSGNDLKFDKKFPKANTLQMPKVDSKNLAASQMRYRNKIC